MFKNCQSQEGLDGNYSALLRISNREVIARFEQERQALAIMDHPNIADSRKIPGNCIPADDRPVDLSRGGNRIELG